MFTSVFLSRARTVRECVFLFLFVHFSLGGFVCSSMTRVGPSLLAVFSSLSL